MALVLCCDAVWSGRFVQTFKRITLPTLTSQTGGAVFPLIAVDPVFILYYAITHSG